MRRCSVTERLAAVGSTHRHWCEASAALRTRFNAPPRPATPTWRHRCLSSEKTRNLPVSNDQSDLSGLPIFAPQAVAVDQDQRPRGNGGRIASLPTKVAPAEQRPVSLSASELAGETIDWGLVRSFRRQAAETLSNELRDRSVGAEREREIGREIITRLLAEHVDAQVRGGAGSGLFTASEQDRMARALFDSLFGLGRLQALVDDDTVENIEVYGHDRVTLVYAGGLITPGPPVADSDDDLIEQLQFLAGRAGVSGRPFSPADPQLDL